MQQPPPPEYGLEVAPPTSSYAPSSSGPVTDPPGSSVMGFDEELGRLGSNAIRPGVRRLFLSSGSEGARRECRITLERLRVGGTQHGWCKLCKLAPSKEGGYIQVSVGGTNKVAVLQDVLLWSEGRHANEGDHVSHLCARPTCLVAGHVVPESPTMNNSRKNCLVWFDCPHCSDSKKILVCQHRPYCIKYCEGYSSMEDLVQRGVCSTVEGIQPVGR